jgi:hypothetical protein
MIKYTDKKTNWIIIIKLMWRKKEKTSTTKYTKNTKREKAKKQKKNIKTMGYEIKIEKTQKEFN